MHKSSRIFKTGTKGLLRNTDWQLPSEILYQQKAPLTRM